MFAPSAPDTSTSDDVPMGDGVGGIVHTIWPRMGGLVIFAPSAPEKSTSAKVPMWGGVVSNSQSGSLPTL